MQDAEPSYQFSVYFCGFVRRAVLVVLTLFENNFNNLLISCSRAVVVRSYCIFLATVHKRHPHEIAKNWPSLSAKYTYWIDP